MERAQSCTVRECSVQVGGTYLRSLLLVQWNYVSVCFRRYPVRVLSLYVSSASNAGFTFTPFNAVSAQAFECAITFSLTPMAVRGDTLQGRDRLLDILRRGWQPIYTTIQRLSGLAKVRDK